MSETMRTEFEKKTGANMIHDGQLLYHKQYSEYLETRFKDYIKLSDVMGVIRGLKKEPPSDSTRKTYDYRVLYNKALSDIESDLKKQMEGK